MALPAVEKAQTPPPRWQTLPATPPLPTGMQTARLSVGGVALWYAVVGEGPPVVLLHGGLANANYWGHQIEALRSHRTVIALDSRGHGRSERDLRPFSYDLMTDDVAALLTGLGVAKADIVGWSDGGIIGLDLAMRYPDRIGRLLAFAGNTRTSGVQPDAGAHSPVFAAYRARAAREYADLSGTPSQFRPFAASLARMWQAQPNWTDAQLRTIRTQVLIADGDHDEVISRSHTAHMAATIPGARLAILPGTSHFAFLQDPPLFNAAMLRFLESG